MDQHTYGSYIALEKYSKLSRYLLSTKDSERVGDIKKACLTNSRHFSKAVHHLDNIITFFEKEHQVITGKIQLDCPDIKSKKFKKFVYKEIEVPDGL
ncbi:hypothetical protein [uncultured Aquimarina sp.]|uniref:hypothetical protein n=1 Tax=uncultured Aquimarina sp. TaxID=575652 RepID=UPI00261E5BF2|nr:hypothetical protein [uncultured Aquimarina sp.]